LVADAILGCGAERWAEAQIVAAIRARSVGSLKAAPPIAETSVAVATGMSGPWLPIVARERVSGKPDAPSQERPHGPEVAGTGQMLTNGASTRANVRT